MRGKIAKKERGVQGRKGVGVEGEKEKKNME
jgi:hypothetical protein